MKKLKRCTRCNREITKRVIRSIAGKILCDECFDKVKEGES